MLGMKDLQAKGPKGGQAIKIFKPNKVVELREGCRFLWLCIECLCVVHLTPQMSRQELSLC